MGTLKDLYKYSKCNGNKDVMEIYDLLLDMMRDLEIVLKDNYHERAWAAIEYDYSIQESSCGVVFYSKNPFAPQVPNSAPVLNLVKLNIYVASNKDGTKDYRSVYEVSSFGKIVSTGKPVNVVNTPTYQIKNIVESSSLKLDETNIRLILDELDKSWKLAVANTY